MSECVLIVRHFNHVMNPPLVACSLCVKLVLGDYVKPFILIKLKLNAP